MKFPHFFIERPIFAGVISVIIVLVGAAAYFTLPVSQYPEIVPPTVSVHASYPGASAETVADTVAAPIEQEINGVDNMLYMSSQETGDGEYALTVTFKLGTDLNAAQVLVQNRIAVAQARLPDEVQRIGLTVRKNSPDLLEVIHFISPKRSLDQAYVSNYVTLHVRDRLSRLDGVGDVRIFGARDYAMRIWIDPEKAAARDLTAGEIVAALRNQNVQVAAGALGAPPFDRRGAAFELNIQALGRLTTPEQFGDVIVKGDAQGRLTRVRDIGRVELGAQDYTVNAYLDGAPAAAVGVFQRPGSNALQTAAEVKRILADVAKTLPPGLEVRVVYNPTEFVAESIKEVEKTLFIAVILVVFVVVLFLQNWRAAVIPVLAIPVALIGTMAVLAALGFSLNTLSLFGLVLAIGIVVDDAIVVVENVERNMEAGLSPRDGAHRSMDEVGGALVAIALVLTAVFVPTALIAGISGQFYRQFAITIATATLISLLVSLTLSPALAALLLQPKQEGARVAPWARPFVVFGRTFNRGFAWTGLRYGRLTGRLVRLPLLMLAVYAGLIGLTGWRFGATPGGFIPAQDQGYYINIIQLPPGSSLSRTDAVMRKVVAAVKGAPGVAHAVIFTGLDAASFTNAPNVATIFWKSSEFADRAGRKGQDSDSILADLRRRVATIDEANVLLIPPPPVQGIGTGGGYKLIVEDQAGRGYKALESVSNAVIGQANATPGLTSVFTQFNTGTPRVFADIDREKAQMLGVPPEHVFETMETYLGSAFINEFNLLGRTYRVTAQADAPFRRDLTAIGQLKARSTSGGMVPIGSVANFRTETGPYRVVRYNLYPAVEIQGDKLPTFSSGQALGAMEAIAAKELPQGFGSEWTELAYQQRQAGNTAGIAFGMAVVFVFLLLAAQYESLTLPLAIVLIVPMCLLAAIVGVDIRHFDNNILTQIGFVVLIGLAAKNAILIVEFARQNEAEGQDRWAAARHAAQTRLRPILMTSLAFILGVVPLAIATGPGAEMRQALGTAVFFGMAGVTGFGLLFTPVFYVVTRGLADRLSRMAGGRRRSGPPAPPAVAEPAE